MNKNLIYNLLLILIFFKLPMLAHAGKGDNSMLLDKPYFTLYVETADCHGPILFNGQQLSFEDGSTNYTEYPVNQWIKQGENTISMFLYNGKNHKHDISNCKLTLRIRQSGSDSNINSTIATLNYSAESSKTGNGTQESSNAGKFNSQNRFEADNNGDVIVTEVTKLPENDIGIQIERKITLPRIGLPKWAYFDSNELTTLKVQDIWGKMDDATHERIVKEILPIYRKIWTALKNKDVNSIMPLYAERSNEMDTAFYNPQGQLLSELKSAFQHAVNDPERKLQPLNEKELTAHVYDNDKLVSLHHTTNKPVIYFEYNDGIVEYYDLILRKQGDRWIITR